MTPDTNMVERVARAIVEELGRQRVSPSLGRNLEGINPPLDVDAISRAAIAAMREPTEAMSGAGGATQVTPIADNWTQDIGDFSAAESYRAMIDAALAEGPK